MSSTLAVSTALFDGYDMALAFAEIAAAGLQHVEPAYIAGYTDFTEATFSEATARQLVDLGVREGVTIAAVSAHLDLGAVDADTPLKLANRIRFAAACGSKILITNAGLSRDADRIARRIEAALPLCKALGIVLALENPGHGTEALIHDAQSGSSLLARFNHPSLRLNYDVGNVYSYSRGTKQPHVDILAAGQEDIGYVHLKDLRSEGTGWAFCSIGSGEVDFQALLGILRRRIPMSIELPLRLRRPGRGDPVRQNTPVPLAAIRTALRNSIKDIEAATS